MLTPTTQSPNLEVLYKDGTCHVGERMSQLSCKQIVHSSCFVISVSNTDVRFRLDTFRAQFYIRVSGLVTVNWTKIGGQLFSKCSPLFFIFLFIFYILYFKWLHYTDKLIKYVVTKCTKSQKCITWTKNFGMKLGVILNVSLFFFLFLLLLLFFFLRKML